MQQLGVALTHLALGLGLVGSLGSQPLRDFSWGGGGVRWSAGPDLRCQRKSANFVRELLGEFLVENLAGIGQHIRRKSARIIHPKDFARTIPTSTLEIRQEIHHGNMVVESCANATSKQEPPGQL